jgi:hypothetical protein
VTETHKLAGPEQILAVAEVLKAAKAFYGGLSPHIGRYFSGQVYDLAVAISTVEGWLGKSYEAEDPTL